jgi:GTPase SAR1 family protein
VFSGEINVGKTAFITRVTKDTFLEGLYQNTIGVDFVTKEYPIGKDSARVKLWDMAGGERKYLRLNSHYRGIHSFIEAQGHSASVSALMTHTAFKTCTDGSKASNKLISTAPYT